jgi:hypothetical protein
MRGEKLSNSIISVKRNALSLPIAHPEIHKCSDVLHNQLLRWRRKKGVQNPFKYRWEKFYMMLILIAIVNVVALMYLQAIKEKFRRSPTAESLKAIAALPTTSL